MSVRVLLALDPLLSRAENLVDKRGTTVNERTVLDRLSRGRLRS